MLIKKPAVQPLGDTAVVILAGGFGTRIRHLTGEIPKPMYAVYGRPFIEWVVRSFVRQGFNRIFISTGYKSEILERHFKAGLIPNTSVVCIPETEPLGTAGGFLNAARKSGITPRNWLIANGDSLLLASYSEILGQSSVDVLKGGIFGVETDDASRFGTLDVTKAGRLLRFSEKRPGPGLINAGIYALGADLLERFPAKRPLSFEIDVFPALLEEGTSFAVTKCDAPFIDIGTVGSLNQAENFIRCYHDRLQLTSIDSTRSRRNLER